MALLEVGFLSFFLASLGPQAPGKRGTQPSSGKKGMSRRKIVLSLGPWPLTKKKRISARSYQRLQTISSTFIFIILKSKTQERKGRRRKEIMLLLFSFFLFLSTTAISFHNLFEFLGTLGHILLTSSLFFWPLLFNLWLGARELSREVQRVPCSLLKACKQRLEEDSVLAPG